MSDPTAGAAQPSLERVIGVGGLAASAINMTVGAGIFVLPALVAAQIGPTAILAYVVCAGAMGLVLLCFAAAGTRVEESGGACAYVDAAFGPFAGFLASTLLWLAYGAASIAAVANAMVGTIASVAPVATEPVPRFAILATLFIGSAWINVRGAKQGARANKFMAAAKLFPLVLLILVGIFFIELDNLRIGTLPGLAAFGPAALMLVFAFQGAESALTPSGEIVDPSRTIPRGLFLGLTGVVVVYMGLQMVAQGVLGAALPGETEAPLAATAARVFGTVGIGLLLGGAAVSMLGTVVGDHLLTPRAILASAEDEVLPAWLATIHPVYHTPYRCIMLYATLGFAFAVSGAFVPLAVLSSVALLMVYLATVWASVVLKRRDVRGSGPPLVLPGGTVIPIAATAVVGWLLAQATWQEWRSISIMLAAAALFYLVRRRSPHPRPPATPRHDE